MSTIPPSMPPSSYASFPGGPPDLPELPQDIQNFNGANSSFNNAMNELVKCYQNNQFNPPTSTLKSVLEGFQSAIGYVKSNPGDDAYGSSWTSAVNEASKDLNEALNYVDTGQYPPTSSKYAAKVKAAFSTLQTSNAFTMPVSFSVMESSVAYLGKQTVSMNKPNANIDYTYFQVQDLVNNINISLNYLLQAYPNIGSNGEAGQWESQMQSALGSAQNALNSINSGKSATYSLKNVAAALEEAGGFPIS